MVEPDEIPEKVTEGGIVIPETSREQYQQAQSTGVLRALGPEAYLDKPFPWAYKGDRVAFNRYVGLVVNGNDGKEYRLINDTEVLAILDESIELGALERRTSYEQ